MNKLELTEALGRETSLTKGRAEGVVELFFGEMFDALANGDRVGIWSLCSKKDYPSSNVAKS